MARIFHCYIIAGSNGAGKTTFALEFLPRFTDCTEFVNADLVAQGLSPFSPESVAVRAGRLISQRIKELVEHGRDFAFETTLSGRTNLRLINDMRLRGYQIEIHYLWIPSVELALRRIENRVRKGGHSVPESVVRRRFDRSLGNLFRLYHSLANKVVLYDNSTTQPSLVAVERNDDIEVLDKVLCHKIWTQAGVKYEE